MRTSRTNCCSASVTHHMGDFGAPFCRGVEPFLANLQALLEQAGAVGLYNDPIVTAAQATYDDINGYVVYLPFGSDCDRHTAEVQAAIARITPVIQNAGGSIAVPRPDAAPADPYGIPMWVKIGGGGLLAVILLGQLSPVIGLVTGIFKPSKRRSTAGYRRRR